MCTPTPSALASPDHVTAPSPTPDATMRSAQPAPLRTAFQAVAAARGPLKVTRRESAMAWACPTATTVRCPVREAAIVLAHRACTLTGITTGSVPAVATVIVAGWSPGTRFTPAIRYSKRPRPTPSASDRDSHGSPDVATFHAAA